MDHDARRPRRRRQTALALKSVLAFLLLIEAAQAQYRRQQQQQQQRGGQQQRHQQQQYQQQQYQQQQQQQRQQQQRQQQQKEKEENYYSILGLRKSATPKDIKSAYRKLALKYHPDKVSEDEKESAEKKFVSVAGAYAILSDEEKRRIYDKYGKKGLEAHEAGHDPEQAGFGGGGSFGGGHGGFDPFSMFNDMFGGGGGGGGQRTHFNTGGGFPGGGGGGFPGGGGGQRQRPPAEELYPKGGTVSPLGKAKFPDVSSRYLWLIVFYDNEERACSQSQKMIQGFAEKVKGTYKVGAVNCGRSVLEAKFCEDKGADLNDLPLFAMIADGEISLFQDGGQIPSPKQLHDFAVAKTPFDMVKNINHPTQIGDRLLSKKEKTKFLGAVLLLTDKYETSAMYASLAYRHRSEFAFGESRAKNLAMAKEFGVKKYPTLIALKSNEGGDGISKTVQYSGPVKADDIGRWLDNLRGEFGGGRADKQKKRQ